LLAYSCILALSFKSWGRARKSERERDEREQTKESETEKKKDWFRESEEERAHTQ